MVHSRISFRVRRAAFAFWLALVAGLLPGSATLRVAAEPVLRGPSPSLLAIYVLAYDNRPGSSMDLTPHYAATLSSIVAATAGHPEKRAVILADLHAVGDTHIRVVANGAVTTIAGLLNANGALDTSVREYDVTDGPTLGLFFRWARQNYPADVTTLTYVGHGTPLPPETNWLAVFGPATRRAPAASLPPLPTNIGANPDFTDMHMPVGSPRPYSLLSPYALAQGMAMAGGSGGMPFQMVDLVMCFAASIEEFYEIAPYTPYITGSPNYAFFDPTGPGQVLAAVSPAMAPDVIAKKTIQTYHALLPATNHPRILAAVDSSQLAGVKQSWDQTAAALYALLTDVGQRPAAAQKLRDAYLASLKYDLTYCPPPEWELATPDGLVDLRTFAFQLTRQFSGTAIAAAADATRTLIRGSATPAVIDRVALNGPPWFDPTPQTWVFDGPDGSTIDDDAAGLSVYADMIGRPISPTLTELSWHAHWYHDGDPTGDNPHPFAFLSDGTTGVGWDEVFQEYWNGQTTRTAACIPDLEPARSGDEVLDDLQALALQPTSQTVPVSTPVRLSLVVSTLRSVRPVLARFQVFRNGALVFENEVNSGPLLPGTHQIAASATWLPAAGNYAVKAMIDADNRLIEASEGNNSADLAMAAVDKPGKPPLLSGGALGNRQLLPSRTVPLSISQDQASAPPVDRLIIQTYQFVAGPSEPLIPILLGKEVVANPTLPNLAATLPAATRPGAVVLHIWAMSPAGRSLDPLVVRLNYAPPNADLAANTTHFYRISANRGDKLGVMLTMAQGQNADLLLWEPFVNDEPTQRAVAVGGATIQIDSAPLGGMYALGVRADGPSATYTLQGIRNSTPLRQPDASGPTGSPLPGGPRPQFVEPIAAPPDLQVFVPMLVR